MAVVYQGIPVSPGAAMGRVRRFRRAGQAIPETRPADPAKELERFRQCLDKAVEETERLRDQAKDRRGGAESGILEAQLAFLQDRYSVVEPIERAIMQEGLNMAQAIERVLGGIVRTFQDLEDGYLRQRAEDAEDIRRRLLDWALEGPDRSCGSLPPGTVVVAEELTPTDTVCLDLDHVSAIVTWRGGYSSHVGIITRERGIPGVCGLPGACQLFQDGEEVLVNGDEGTVTGRLGREERARFARHMEREGEQRARLEGYRRAPTRAADGTQGVICANIGDQTQGAHALEAGAEGVGLLRSEFLYLDCPTLPGEEEQFRAYQTVLEDMGGRPVYIRTLDVGGDKELAALPMRAERNPFLGCRGLRLCLQRPELLRTQLRALLRAGAYGNLGILFPMVSGVEELRQAKGQLAQVRKELEEEGYALSPVRVGVMVEVPSAALLAEQLAREADFFSIGTNDLIQYTLACERGNPAVEHLYSPCHPAVLRLVDMAARAARKAGIPCGLCGEAAADPELLPLFWGLGLRGLSMAPGAVLRVRAALARLDTAQCQALASQALACAGTEEVLALLHHFRKQQSASG